MTQLRRILFATTSGAGHFGPMEPVAAACAAAGHTVAVAAPQSFAPTLARAGFTHLPFDDSPPDELGAVFATLRRAMYEDGNRTVAREVFGRINTRSALPGMSAIVARWRPDVVVRETAELSSYLVAEANGIPYAQVAVGLAGFDNDFLPEVVPALQILGAGDLEGLWDAPRLTIAPESVDDRLVRRHGPILRYRDPAMTVAGAEPLPDWWAADATPASSSDPLVYVSFGTVAPGLGLYPALYRAAVDALAGLSVRALVTIGAQSDPAAIGPLPPNVHVEPWWPQKQVMAHAAAMVGHGGFGTTMAGLAAGRPMVVLPLFADQPHNADRVEAIGAGIALRGGPAAAAGLGEAVLRVVHERAFAEAAARVAAEMGALPPPSAAVTLIERLTG
ncbi:MAG: glycosyltransferase [Acidimicrobiia bacterium]